MTTRVAGRPGAIFAAAFVLVLAWLALAGAAHAETFRVDVLTDEDPDGCGGEPGSENRGDCTLREAVIASNFSSDRDTIVLGQGRHRLTILDEDLNEDNVVDEDDDANRGDLDINDSVRIAGAPGGGTVIDAEPIVGRVFHLPSRQGGRTARFEDVTIENGDHFYGDGGGVDATSGTTLEFVDSTVRLNHARSGSGGGIATDGALSLRRTTVTGNSSVVGGGGGSGGGIHQGGSQAMDLIDSVISLNQARSSEDAGAGGGVFTQSGSTVTLTGTTVAGNVAEGVVDGNESRGGGLYVAFGSSWTITRSSVSGNSAGSASGNTPGAGGGIYSLDAELRITDSTVADNRAEGRGGGLNLTGSDTLTMASSTLSGNHAAGDGGGLLSQDRGFITNSTVSGNSSDDDGGGVSQREQALDVDSTTFSGNSADDLGDGIHVIGSSTRVEVRQTVFANATAENCHLGPGGEETEPPTIVSRGHNLENGDSCGLRSGGDLVNRNPQLGALAENGGPTRTHALAPSSPALDAGKPQGAGGCPPPATDQRGVRRPQGARCDIGAFELVPSISINDVGVSEGNAGTVNARFQVSMSAASGEPAQVDFATENGSASAGADYASRAGTVQFAPGETTKFIDVPVTGDTADESDEDFFVRLSRPAGATLANERGRGTITDDDAPSGPAQPRQGLPPPVVGQTFNLELVRGVVFFRNPGARRPQRLRDPRQLRIGATIDTRRGRARLTSAADLLGGTQTADFFDGLFQVRQRVSAQPITDVLLRGSLRGLPRFGGRTTFGRLDQPAAADGPQAQAAARGRRRLWGSGRGRFRTRGRRSSATVRGTLWLVQDFSNGTLTRVREGSVLVRDFVRDVDVLLGAGQSYFARAPRPARRTSPRNPRFTG